MSTENKTANSNQTKTQSKTITCNLHNPTRARRVINDGIDGGSVTIEAGETKRNVTISRVIAEELRDRNRAEKNSDVQVRPLTADEPDEPKEEELKEPTIS